MFRPGNFCALEAEFSDPSGSRFVVIPVPYDGTVTYRCGARAGPGAILTASSEIELHDFEINSDTYLAGIHTLPQIEPVVDPSDMVDRVAWVVEDVLENNRIPVLLGGEHTISIGAVRALAARHDTLTVLQIDAHADLRDQYQGSKFNHGCTARRISEICPVTVAGVRACSSEEIIYLKTRKARVFSARALQSNPEIVDEILNGLSDQVYLSIDLDGFDPSLIRATGTPEPGGLSWQTVTGILEKVCSEKNVMGFDCVELSPIPGDVSSEYIAAKLIYRVMGFLHLKEKGENPASSKQQK